MRFFSIAICITATYREALQKLPKVMDQSDANVGSGNDKNRLCRNKGNASDSSGSDGDDSLSPKIPRPPMIGKNCCNFYHDC